jgi:hypothetical protein
MPRRFNSHLDKIKQVVSENATWACYCQNIIKARHSQGIQQGDEMVTSDGVGFEN